jgi:hypothetical protein
LVVERRNFVIITYHLPIPVEIQNPRPYGMAGVKAAGYGDIIPHPHGHVEGVFRARGGILPGIKYEL